MSKRPAAFALGCAVALGCVLGAGIAFVALRDRVPSDAQIGPRATEILSGKDPLGRVTELSALLSKLGLTAVSPLTAAFEAGPVDPTDPELVVLALWWARIDPKAALAWFTADGRARPATIAAIFRTWGHSDPNLALGTARMLSFHLHQETAIDAAIVGWDESGQPGLLEGIAELEGVDLQRLAGSYARRRVTALGPAAALRWVDSLAPTPRLQQLLAERVASAAAESKGGAALAAAWATPRVRSDDRISNFPRRIATRWVAHDPNAAMAWLASLPAGADRSDGVTEAFRDWMQRDRVAALAWIEHAERQSWNEPARALYARVISRERPRDAIDLAQGISDPQLREGTMGLIARVWVQQDRAAAEAWLAQPDVPERVRKVARSPGPTMPGAAAGEPAPTEM